METRELNNSDYVADLVTLSREFFDEYQGNHEYLFKIDRIDESNITGYFARFVGNVNKKAFIALEQDRIIGYITVLIIDQPDYWAIKQIGHISGLMVGKQARRKGIASALLRSAIDYLRQQGIRQYTVFTSVNNIAGIEFYKAAGLTPSHTTLLGEIDSISIPSDCHRFR